VFSFARNYKGGDPMIGFVTQEARVSVVYGLLNAIFGVLPKEVKEHFEYAGNFGLKDYSKVDATPVMLEVRQGRSGNSAVV
jgi:hypothetical protein